MRFSLKQHFGFVIVINKNLNCITFLLIGIFQTVVLLPVQPSTYFMIIKRNNYPISISTYHTENVFKERR